VLRKIFMKVKFLRKIISFGSCIIFTVAFGEPTQAAPSKAEIDNHARENGFPRSDYPYYEPVNQCGGEGATSAVPDKYEVASNVAAPTLQDPFRTRRVVIFRADFNNACNTHDRCYMTAGKAREDCDAQFNRDLLSACRNPVIPEPTSVATCVALAQTYANTVYAAGAAFYPNAQAQARRYNSLVNNFIAQSQTTPGSSGIALRNQWSGKCLQTMGQAKDNGSPVNIWDCSNTSNQFWTLTNRGELRNNWSGKCLQTMGQAKDNGSPVNIWDCSNTSNQFWR
jgi:hypothetical protein